MTSDATLTMDVAMDLTCKDHNGTMVTVHVSTSDNELRTASLNNDIVEHWVTHISFINIHNTERIHTSQTMFTGI